MYKSDIVNKNWNATTFKNKIIFGSNVMSVSSKIWFIFIKK